MAENLYGQDLDSGHHGSGFPLPPFRQKLLEQHLKKQAAERGPGRDREREGSSGSEREARRQFTPEEVAYSEHPWNINNLPRCKVGARLPQRSADTALIYSTAAGVCCFFAPLDCSLSQDEPSAIECEASLGSQ